MRQKKMQTLGRASESLSVAGGDIRLTGLASHNSPRLMRGYVVPETRDT